ncbi:hypothetical protein FZC84_11960 [Rossellomorea vietnamensis]|uniref:Uncharacterized protein n=1 Tax=Rossellomorea vietnamensis TaxID=218284 RepID=A0A5D4MB58_9BACI|nr:hypothetical protein [Rossellomorea vietnamensis]TYR99084.1 hypothetical protein FZC84_11960 [Rossellomorea vietnamensis]
MSKVEKLIDDGQTVVDRNKQEAMYGGYYVSGVEYEEWIAKVIFFMEDHKEKIPEFLYKRVIEAANSAVGNGTEHFDRIVGVLRTLAERSEFN